MKLSLRTPWVLCKDEKRTENESHSVDPSSIRHFERKKLKAACALNMCMVSLSQIVDYQNLEILKMEYDSILNNLNLEKVVKDKSLLKALQSIMDACHFYILHAKDKEFLKKRQQFRLKSALGNALGGGRNVIAIFGSGNPWAIAAGAAAMIGVAAVNYKSQRDRAKFENEIDEWQLERSALEQLHNLRRTLFETAWHFAEKYNYPDSYRLTEKQISVYNEILRNPDPQTRYENLWLIRDNFKAYPIFWYSLGRAALETSDAFRPDAGDGERKREIAYDDNKELQDEYRKKALEAYKTFKRCHFGNELMREDVVAASAYLDHAQLCNPDNPEELLEILDDTNQAHKLAPMDEEITQACAFRYLQLYDYDKQKGLKSRPRQNGRGGISDENIKTIPAKAAECLRFLLNRDFNPEVNGRALSWLYKKTGEKLEYDRVKAIVSRRCPLVYQRLFPWDAESFHADWEKYLKGDGIKRTAFNLYYGCNWMRHKEFFSALYMAKKSRSYEPLREYREQHPAEINARDKGVSKNGDIIGIDALLGLSLGLVGSVWTIFKLLMENNDSKDEDKSLDKLIHNLLDESYERIPWTLFWSTRATEYIPTKFETSEKELMDRLISEAQEKAKQFVKRFREQEETKSLAFSYEDIKNAGSDAAEPAAFIALSNLELRAEQLRQEIQKQLGDECRFQYPVPDFRKTDEEKKVSSNQDGACLERSNNTDESSTEGKDDSEQKSKSGSK